ncbi:hypothetical protein FJ955_18810 [Mesorhizobium sp. B2-2-2]|uniref:restriction endonuclease subunit S n=1 Tax=Mesorhizobium sp. B2-2-2 TaxID=2589964 RepID=UPI00112DCB96|nr:restriction endonuclease subunit S [Mesorhizobium sp. B2-2-2]TPM27263.1 hypothetical protein FJ955_18810 [Mesorhizobium sp. B2-2-2]
MSTVLDDHTSGSQALPPGWRWAAIGQHYRFKNGLNKAKRFFGQGTPIVNYMDVFNHQRLGADHVQGKVTVTSDEMKNYSAKQGDAFFTRTSETVSEIGMAAVLIEPIDDAVFSGFVLRGRPSNDDLKPHFAAYALRASAVRKQIELQATYTTRALTNGRSLSKVTFALPGDEDQSAIAQALSDIDDLIAALDALIAKNSAIRQGAIQQLLSGKLRLPGFSAAWATVQLGSLCSMKSGEGITSRKISETGRYPVYGANGLRGFTASKTHTGVFPLIGRVGALCGNIQIAKGDFFASEHAIVARPKGQTDPEWLALALGRLGLNRLSEASAQPVLTVGKLAQLSVFAPCDPMEQKAIAVLINDLAGESAALAERRQKTEVLRQGMMQQLLTGRMRLA